MFNRLDEASFDDIYTIMEAAFPYSEHRGRREQRALFALKQYAVYGWRENQQLRAFLAAWDLGEIRFGEHLAVLSEYRNQGIGRKLFQAYEALDSRPLVFEVELPKTPAAKRRIRFYERMGYHYYGDIPYFQGPFHQESTLLPLRIMTNRADATNAEINHYIDLIYQQVYRRKRSF